jgi:precorrin-8X/cobalt-precorrin-8 methylmutase
MTISLQQIAPAEIEQESFRIIAEEIGPHSFDPPTFPIVQRVIHATGDFAFKDNLRFSPQAVRTGIAAIRAGKGILTDVTMVAAGIGKAMLAEWGGRVVCRVADPEVAAKAQATGRTRSEVAMSLALTEGIGIIAIGNAPTALLQVLALLKGWPAEKRPLIVGVPVGFVNAAESKALLAESDLPFITSLGRKGGSPVAAAIVNALLRLAKDESLQ